MVDQLRHIGLPWEPISAALDSKRRYLKEVVKVGKYIKGDLKYDITMELLKNWVKQFKAMKENGVKIPIPMSHTLNPEANRGWVIDMFIKGASLFMIADIIGDDAIASAARSDVSLYSPLEFKDGTGHVYTNPITHVAMVTSSVVPGLGEFIPLAASLSLKESSMDLKKIAKAIKLELTEDTAEKVIIDHVVSLSSAVLEKDEKIKILTTTLEVAKKGQEEPDLVLVSLAADNRVLKLNALVAASCITPDVSKKLHLEFVGEDNKAIALSLKTGTHGVFDGVVKALQGNSPVKLSENTKKQTLELGDPNKSGKNSLEKAVDQMIADAKGS